MKRKSLSKIYEQMIQEAELHPSEIPQPEIVNVLQEIRSLLDRAADLFNNLPDDPNRGQDVDRAISECIPNIDYAIEELWVRTQRNSLE